MLNVCKAGKQDFLFSKDAVFCVSGVSFGFSEETITGLFWKVDSSVSCFEDILTSCDLSLSSSETAPVIGDFNKAPLGLSNIASSLFFGDWDCMKISSLRDLDDLHS